MINESMRVYKTIFPMDCIVNGSSIFCELIVKVGDLVRFIDEGTYSKWFFSRYARVESITYDACGKGYCRVKWLWPVKYFQQMATISDFSADKFEVCNESR